MTSYGPKPARAGYDYWMVQTQEHTFAVRVDRASGLVDAAPPVAGEVVGEPGEALIEFYRKRGYTVVKKTKMNGRA